MKTKKATAFKFLLGLAVISSSFVGAIANDAVLNSDPIDINGYVSEPPATDHELEKVKNELRVQRNAIKINKEKSKTYEKLGRSTEKLAEVTEEMIEERKESQDTIAKYNKKIECLMQEDPGSDCDEYVKRKEDKVSMGMAAPQKVEANVETNAEPQLGDTIKILPYFGVVSIQSENEDLEANLSAGLKVESDITSRFSVGLGFNYMTLKTTDFQNGFAGYTPSFQRGYSQAYGAGREIEYTNMNFDMYSKYFITKTSRFRPYIGAGIAYNRTSAKYAQNNTINLQNGLNSYQFGDEEITANNISARLMGGSEILFTKNIGMNLELQYNKGLGDSFGNQEQRVESPDQRRLRELTDEINNAHIFSMYAGVLVLF